jgi:glycosidase
MIRSLIAATVLLTIAGCVERATPTNTHAGSEPSVTDRYTPKPYVTLENAEWTKDAVIYQINTRQFTPEGTFEAAMAELPRLAEFGVDILWLMPIHPIGEVNRKGTLGSPYSVKDYYGINPEFGTEDDFRAFVAEAHRLGMKVILDWVANHSAWDNPLVEAHPDWYHRNWKGEFHPTSWWDWSDIIEFDYGVTEMRAYMAGAMAYWVREFDIDGYRCDVAGFVPTDFWETVREDLNAIKPVFMLAEWEARDLHAMAFDASYAWSWWEAMHKIAKGEANTASLYVYYSWNESAYPREAMRMTHVTNHDKNSWEGTEFEMFGAALPAAMVLSFVGEGIPLIYNGQEAGNDKRLEFFERDPITWREHENGALYKRLIDLKTETPVLWNGKWGAQMIHVPTSEEGKVLAFVRFDDARNGVFAVFNMSADPINIRFPESLHHGAYVDYFVGDDARFDASSALDLPGWGYKVYVRDGKKGHP